MNPVEAAPVPSIKIYLPANFDGPDILREILYGIEEEGVPCDLRAAAPGESAGEDAAALAFRGAEESVPGVGIGLDGAGRLAVHFRQLPPDKPLFLVNVRREREKARLMASNAARLVKRLPFTL